VELYLYFASIYLHGILPGDLDLSLQGSWINKVRLRAERFGVKLPVVVKDFSFFRKHPGEFLGPSVLLVNGYRFGFSE
jgi:hypothetical protein